MQNRLESKEWGEFEGAKATLWKLTNANGMTMEISDWGGRITTVCAPDREGRIANVSLGWGSLDEYVAENGGTYYGALVGRYGNRIGAGKFTLEGKEYVLELNNSPAGIPCSLHGGLRGFALRMWKCVQEIRMEDKVGVVLEIESPDGEGGFPGNVKVRAAVTLDNSDVIHIGWRAETDKATPISLTCHSYWNLDGTDAGTTIMDHNLHVNSDAITAYGPAMIPTGEIRDVTGTPFDFRTMRTIGSMHGCDYDQLEYGAGYDMNWVLRKNERGDELTPACILESPKTGRRLEVWTTEPGLQIYDGYYLPVRNSGVALETQHYPDSPNRPEFPNTILRPGQTLYSTTEFRFRTF